MSRHEIRKGIVDAMNKEANNGIWQDWENKSEFIFCVRDVIEDKHKDRLVGIITVLKGRGKVDVFPYCDGGEDDGSYIKVTITPR